MDVWKDLSSVDIGFYAGKIERSIHASDGRL